MGWSARVLAFTFLAAAGAYAGPPSGGFHGGGVHVASGHFNGIPAPRNYPRPIGLQPSFGFTGINPGALHTHGVYGRGYNRLPVRYFLAPYYYPYLGYGIGGYGYDSGPSYDTAAESQGPDPVTQGLMEGQDALGQQVADLQQQVAGMTQGYPQQTAPAYAAPQASAAPPPPPQPPVTLVLRSGQQLRVQNFAVMDQTFWDFSSQPTRKIPLNAIDIPASTQATEASGGEFPALTGGE